MKKTSKQLLAEYQASKKHYQKSKESGDPYLLRKLAAEVVRDDKIKFLSSLKSE